MVMPEVWDILHAPTVESVRKEPETLAPTLQVTFVIPQNVPRVLVVISPSTDSHGFIDCTVEDAMLLYMIFRRMGITCSAVEKIDEIRRILK